jgi:hypothetical protein
MTTKMENVAEVEEHLLSVHEVMSSCTWILRPTFPVREGNEQVLEIQHRTKFPPSGIRRI